MTTNEEKTMNKPVRASDIILRDRFNYLKTLFRQAPLSDSKVRELKTLAKKFDPKMAEWMEKNPDLCI